MLLLLGWTAIAETRPLTGESVDPAEMSVWPLGMDSGPSAVQIPVVTDGAPGAEAGSPMAPRRPPLFWAACSRALAMALGGMESAGNARWL